MKLPKEIIDKLPDVDENKWDKCMFGYSINKKEYSIRIWIKKEKE